LSTGLIWLHLATGVTRCQVPNTCYLLPDAQKWTRVEHVMVYLVVKGSIDIFGSIHGEKKKHRKKERSYF